MLSLDILLIIDPIWPMSILSVPLPDAGGRSRTTNKIDVAQEHKSNEGQRPPIGIGQTGSAKDREQIRPARTIDNVPGQAINVQREIQQIGRWFLQKDGRTETQNEHFNLSQAYCARLSWIV